MHNIDLLAYFSPLFCLDCLKHSHDGSRLLPHYNDLIPSALYLIVLLNELLKLKPLVAEVFDVCSLSVEPDTQCFFCAKYLVVGVFNP